jgi:hypothetical protein
MTYGMEIHLHAFVASTVVEGGPMVKPNIGGGFCRGKNALGSEPLYTVILPVA